MPKDFLESCASGDLAMNCKRNTDHTREARKLHSGAQAELLHIAERKRSNASAAFAKGYGVPSRQAEREMWQMKRRCAP